MAKEKKMADGKHKFLDIFQSRKKREKENAGIDEEKYLQIWTIAPLTSAIVEETKGTQASEQMMKINQKLQSLYNTVRPFNPSKKEEAQIPGTDDMQDITAKTNKVYKSLLEWKNNYIQNTPKPSDQVVFMTDTVMKKLEDDYKVYTSINAGQESLSQAAFKHSALSEHYGLENDRKTPLKCPEHLLGQAEQSKKQNQTVVQDQEAFTQNPEDYSYKKMRKATSVLQRIDRDLSAANPDWMLYTSGEFADLRNNMTEFNKWVSKDSKLLNPDINRESGQFKQSVVEYNKKLDSSMDMVVAYLDKKNSDFNKDESRKEDPSKQRWEQKRIRAVLHSYDRLHELAGKTEMTEKGLERHKKVETYKDTLLSDASKKIFADENKPKKAVTK